MPETLPALVEVPLTYIQERACRGRPCPKRAIYDDLTDTLYISYEGLHWKAVDNLTAHEMVHYLQDLAGKFSDQSCANLLQLELEAEHIQRVYVWQVQGDISAPAPIMRWCP